MTILLIYGRGLIALGLLGLAALTLGGCATSQPIYHPGLDSSSQPGRYQTMAECRAAHVQTARLCDPHPTGMPELPRKEPRKPVSPGEQLGWDVLLNLFMWR